MLEAIGRVIKAARERKGLSQRGLSERIAGSSMTRLKLIETGDAGNITLKTLVNLGAPLFPNVAVLFKEVADLLEAQMTENKEVRYAGCKITKFSDGRILLEISK